MTRSGRERHLDLSVGGSSGLLIDRVLSLVSSDRSRSPAWRRRSSRRVESGDGALRRNDPVALLHPVAENACRGAAHTERNRDPAGSPEPVAGGRSPGGVECLIVRLAQLHRHRGWRFSLVASKEDEHLAVDFDHDLSPWKVLVSLRQADREAPHLLAFGSLPGIGHRAEDNGPRSGPVTVCRRQVCPRTSAGLTGLGHGRRQPWLVRVISTTGMMRVVFSWYSPKPG